MRVPGVFDPLEALRAIKEGQACRMMLVSLGGLEVGRGRSIEVDALMPMSEQNGPYRYDAWRRPHAMSASGTCVFFSNHRCSLHSTTYKPRECREALLCNGGYQKGSNDEIKLDYWIATRWSTPVAHYVIRQWQLSLFGHLRYHHNGDTYVE